MTEKHIHHLAGRGASGGVREIGILLGATSLLPCGFMPPMKHGHCTNRSNVLPSLGKKLEASFPIEHLGLGNHLSELRRPVLPSVGSNSPCEIGIYLLSPRT